MKKVPGITIGIYSPNKTTPEGATKLTWISLTAKEEPIGAFLLDRTFDDVRDMGEFDIHGQLEQWGVTLDIEPEKALIEEVFSTEITNFTVPMNQWIPRDTLLEGLGSIYHKRGSDSNKLLSLKSGDPSVVGCGNPNCPNCGGKDYEGKDNKVDPFIELLAGMASQMAGKEISPKEFEEKLMGPREEFQKYMIDQGMGSKEIIDEIAAENAERSAKQDDEAFLNFLNDIGIKPSSNLPS